MLLKKHLFIRSIAHIPPLIGSTRLPYIHLMKAILQQAGVIAYRHAGDDLQVLLITSRGAGRWVIPKGGIEKGQTPAQAAALEAYEEAGVRGILSTSPLGSFTYNKRPRRGAAIPAIVEVYAMRVDQQLKNWPERAERRLKWVSIPEALKLVEEDGMAVLLLKLQQIDEQAHAHA
jgi:8-oxo-dGTP pyrophosphatase MutT (NUDIX family)